MYSFLGGMFSIYERINNVKIYVHQRESESEREIKTLSQFLYYMYSLKYFENNKRN